MTADSRRVCVFCGSSAGARQIYAEAARSVGHALAERGLGLVYGGGQVGLMGILADAALGAGGEVIGVIPEALSSKEVAHYGITELIIVPNMHERKALMASRSGSFLMLPGGIGTFEEFFEVWTWAALGLHRKPIGVLNIDGYFDPLLQFLQHAVAERFVGEHHLKMLVLSERVEDLIDRLPGYRPPVLGPRWIDRDQT